MTTPLVVDSTQRTDTSVGQRIGLFGGTFDPVHYGHLRSAVEMAEQYALSTLYLLPNHRPAHRGPTGATTQMRIDMLRMSIDSVNQLALDAREAVRDKPTYTVDTLQELQAEQPDTTVLFFLGMDAFAEFDTWHNWERVLELTNLVVVNRPGATHSAFSRNLMLRQQRSQGKRIVNGRAGVIETCDVTQLAISATDVRRRIAENLNVRFLLPEQVSEYIAQKRLYRVNG